MKHIITCISKCTIVIFLLMAGFGTSLAQAPNPPHLPYPLSPDKSPNMAAMPGPNAGIALGQPGFSLRYVSTLGITGEPYPADAAHLFHPIGVMIDNADNLYVAEERGNRVLGYNAAGGNFLTIGHAGVGDWSDGYLYYPHEIAKDAQGNLWVTTADAVKVFDSSGNQLNNFTSPDEASPVHFNDPIGIAFDQQGLLFVAEKGNHRIQIFNASSLNLTYVNTIGEHNVPGNDNQHFNQPMMIAFDSSNALYTMDLGNYRVQKCTSSNGWINWTCNKFFGGQAGMDPSKGQLGDGTMGITIDSSNNVFIADGANFRVLKCTPAGVCSHFVGTTGVKGIDNAHFGWLSDVGLDSQGNVYVADYENMRVQVYSSAGAYVKTVGETGVPYVTDSFRYHQPWTIAAARNGGLYIHENRGRRLIKVNLDGSQAWVVGKAGISGSSNDTFAETGYWGDSGIPAETLSGKVYLPDCGNNRIQIFNADTGAYLSTFGQYGSGNNQFKSPYGIAINPTNQDILVSDQYNHRVQVYNSDWVFKTTIGVNGVTGTDNQHFNRPKGVAVDKNGVVFVADSDNLRVQKCTTNGITYTCATLIQSVGLADNNDFGNIHPVSLALDAAGRVYVASDWNNQVQVYDSGGAYLTSIGGTYGQHSGAIRYPESVVADSSGSVYVTDPEHQRVQKFAVGVPGWVQKNINGFGDPNNVTIAGLVVHNGMLYAGTQNTTSGGQVWRTADGRNWSAINLYGGAYNGGANIIVGPNKEINGYLYVGTQNNNTGGQMWRCALCDGSDWDRVLDGSELGSNYFIVQTVIEHAGALYATLTSWDGLAVLRSTNGAAGTWTQVNTSGFGKSSNVYTWTAVDYDGYYYVATNTPDSWNFEPATTTGVEVWRCSTCTGSDWQQVNESGFGDGRNGAYSMVEFNNTLYLSVINLQTGVQIRRCAVCDGNDWEQVNTNGFGAANRYGATLVPYGGKLLAFTTDLWTSPDQGVELFITQDGTQWEPVMIHGWGDSNNWVVNGIQVFAGSLYVGAFNSVNGGEVWQFLDRQVFLPLITR